MVDRSTVSSDRHQQAQHISDAASLSSHWEDMLSELTERFAGGQQAGALRLWLASNKVHLNGIDGEALILDCPTALFGQQIRKHFSAVLCEMASARFKQVVSDVQCRVNRHALQEHRSRLQEAEVATPNASWPGKSPFKTIFR